MWGRQTANSTFQGTRRETLSGRATGWIAATDKGAAVFSGIKRGRGVPRPCGSGEKPADGLGRRVIKIQLGAVLKQLGD